MAGEWIKMRLNLVKSPKVVRMASALNADRFQTVGALHAVWSLFDEHSEDGTLDGYRPELLDEVVGFPGIAGAMISVEWLIDSGHSLAMPRFDSHNGQSAKRRAMEAERKRLERLSASNADKEKTKSGPEKRREEKNSSYMGGEPPAGPEDGPSLAGLICVEMRLQQIRGANPHNPKLLDAIAAGATLETFKAAAEISISKEKKEFAYVAAVALGILADAAKPKAPRAARRDQPSAMQGTIDNTDEALALLGIKATEGA